MRADRLLSLLMLLQTRGRMTAEELAGALEVSVRTIYRDLDALSLAGVPVYTDRGPGGGCELDEHYRTNLTGLNGAELRALFLLTGPAISPPAPLADLGMGQELQAALLKLTAALPGTHRQEEERVRRRFLLDPVAWFNSGEPVPHLHALREAVWADRRVEITYRPRYRLEVSRVLDAYGLVAKTNLWFLIGRRDNGWWAYPLAQIQAVRLLAEPFERDPRFDLAGFWAHWSEGYESETTRATFAVRLRVSAPLADELGAYFGEQAECRAGPPDVQGRRTLDLEFESFEAARDRVLALGRAVEVLEPEPLRLSVIDYARQIVGVYEEESRE